MFITLGSILSSGSVFTVGIFFILLGGDNGSVFIGLRELELVELLLRFLDG